MTEHGYEVLRKWCAWCLTWTEVLGNLTLVLWQQEHLDGTCVGADPEDPSELALREEANQDCEGGDCGVLGVDCGPCLAARKLRERAQARNHTGVYKTEALPCPECNGTGKFVAAGQFHPEANCLTCGGSGKVRQ